MLLLNLQKLWKGLRPIVFFPGTLVRTWGTRPVFDFAVVADLGLRKKNYD
jgi:hypothetical protein